MDSAKIIQFPASKRIRPPEPKLPARQPKPTQRPIIPERGPKYFNEAQIRLLRRTVRDAATLCKSKKQERAIREWLAVDILTSTGCRVAECADVRVGDIKSGYGQSALFIRCGKNRKSRTIQIPASLRKHLQSFLAWKKNRGEATGSDDFLFIGQRGPWKPTAIAQLVKKHLRQLGLYESGKSVHALRHSYAFALYRRERDLLTVKKQLGHSSIQSTLIYAEVSDEDVQAQIRGLWGTS